MKTFTEQQISDAAYFTQLSLFSAKTRGLTAGADIDVAITAIDAVLDTLGVEHSRKKSLAELKAALKRFTSADTGKQK